MSNLITFILHVLWFSILSGCFISKADGLSCICSPCDEHLNNTCEVEPKGKCFTLKYEQENGHQHLIFGCATKENNVPQLANLIVSPLHSRAIDYCDDEDFCNNNLQPLLHITSDSSTDYKFLIGCLFGSLSVFLVVLSYSSLYQFRLHSARDTNDFLEINFDRYLRTKDERYKHYPRAIELIKRGKFTDVWKAVYKGEYVAVKVWSYGIKDEYEIRNNLQLVHKNILRIIGSEDYIVTRKGFSYDNMIITAYHANRDLSTFLHTNVLDLRTMINMAYDISSGIKYLHSLSSVRILKLQILHIFLESRNILVKDDLTCCIGDFGGICNPLEFNYRRPDKVRYLAPELLMLTGCDPYIVSYSVSLVFWEMARRCNACGIPEEYQLPYFNDVSINPSKEEMIDVVCTRGIRPLIEPRWLTNKTLSEFVYLMTSNWQLEPTNRMRSSHIKRKLAKLRVVLGKSSWLSLFQ